MLPASFTCVTLLQFTCDGVTLLTRGEQLAPTERGDQAMAFIQCGLALLASGSVLVGSHTGTPVRKLERGNAPAMYSAHQLEAYLTPQQVEYIRPGLKITVASVTIPADRRPVVEVTFVDDLDQPLDRLGKVTPGAISISFVLAYYNPEARDYVAYTTRTQTSPITGQSAVQASADSGGTWEDLGLGRARYRFKTALPEGFAANKTHTLGIYATRNLTAILGKNYYANVLYDFRPDGQAVTAKWDGLSTAVCNSCHDPLQAHGGARREVKLCVLCHNATQSLDPDTGNKVEFREMIHKIHRGKDLPSVQAGRPYRIIGFNQSVNDYSTVAFPQDIRNCTKCHQGTSEAHIWYTRPNRTACGSCHDNVNWETGEGHAAGPQANDDACASCHVPEGESEFDASIKGAHTVPTKSKQLRGLSMEILAVTNAAPGQKPTVTFRVTNKDDGSVVAPSSLNSLNLHLGGPTTDYASYVTESARGASFNGDTAVYTFNYALPADASGTWVVTADAYRNVTIDNHTETGLTLREAAQNPVYYFAVTDSQPQPRRAVVDLANCNKCHDTLALHGGQRFKTEECVVCHNANKDDRGRRPADKQPPESVHFKYLIHKIHTGEELSRDFTVYGFGNVPHNYNEVRYPGDRRNCVTCHKSGTYQLPLPSGLLPTQAPRDYYTPIQPEAAACLSCHDTAYAAAHAYVNTAPFAEACAACHGNNAEFSVDKVHAR